MSDLSFRPPRRNDESIPHSLLGRFFQPETGVFLALWLFLMLVGQTRLFRDPGTYWHTRVGQIMLDEHRLVHTDPFSFTRADHPWLPHQWLGELGMALGARIAGWDFLLLAAGTFLALLYTWLAHRLLRAGLHWILAGVLTTFAVAVSAAHFHVRPHIVTIAFFAITCAAINDFELGRVRLSRLFWLVPLYALWTNLHGGMLGGLATLGLALVGWSFFRFVGLSSPFTRWRDAGVFLLLIVACALTAFINPYGWRLPAVWIEIMRLPQLTEIIVEHSPLDPARPDGLLTLAFGAGYVILLMCVRPTSQLRVAWLIPLAWLFLATTRIRHAPLFSVAALLAIADMFPHTFLARRIVDSGGDLFVPPADEPPCRPVPVSAFLLPALLVVVTGVLQSAGVQAPLVGAGWARFPADKVPVELADKLRLDDKGQLRPEGTPIFNDLNFGGFLIHNTPNLRVFIDDRCELFGRDLLLEHHRARQSAEAAAELIPAWRKQFGFELALVEPGTPIDAYFHDPDNGWQLVAETPAARFYRSAQRNRGN